MTDLQLGDRFSFEKDGVIYTDTVESVHYSSATPAVYRRLNRWQSLARRFTPKRWRQPLLIRAAEPSVVTINGEHNPVGRTLTQLEEMTGIFAHSGLWL